MRRILVVDDDPHICQAIGIWLRQHGFRVSVADRGISGLAALEHSTFDLMIVDVFMPDMRGFESIRVFHHRAPAVPLIAISGSAFPDPETSAPDFLRVAARLGATRCLRKPFKPATLLRRLTSVYRNPSHIEGMSPLRARLRTRYRNRRTRP